MSDAAQAPAPGTADLVRNRTFDEIAVGDRASMTRTLTHQDMQLLAVLAGDAGAPCPDPPDGCPAHAAVAQGLFAAGLLAALVGTRLPGPGARLLRQRLRFERPPRIGDTLRMDIEVTARDAGAGALVMACGVHDQDGACVLEGEIEVAAPDRRIERPRATLPEVRLSSGSSIDRLHLLARPLGPVRMAVVHPCDALSLAAALQARDAGLALPVLVGPAARIAAIAAEQGLDLDGIAVEDVPHSHAAAARAAELAGRGEVEALVKGSLHTDELMAAVLAAEAGLRTKRRASHCFLMQVPAYPRPFIITDAAINIAPTLAHKADIVRNAIELAQVVGVARPKVAILAAVETVSATMPATLDAAALCKMADRGQIAGAVLDGPLAFDNAVSVAAARIKGIASEVAGQADILVVPDLESGNMLAKQLEYLAGADSAGIVLGARVPVVLTSRADGPDARLASCAIAVMLAHHYRSAPP